MNSFESISFGSAAEKQPIRISEKEFLGKVDELLKGTMFYDLVLASSVLELDEQGNVMRQKLDSYKNLLRTAEAAHPSQEEAQKCRRFLRFLETGVDDETINEN